MKKTGQMIIYPMSRGLDTESVPGTQDIRALTKANNVVISSKNSLRKMPGLRRIPTNGDSKGVQGTIHLFGTIDGGQVDEIFRVRNGRLEVQRNTGESYVDLDHSVSPTDTVTFEKFANVLNIHFDNSRPQKYIIRGDKVEDKEVPSDQINPPPRFARNHDFRLWHAGVTNDPHRLTASEINNPFGYDLNKGAFRMRVRDGDNDPVGITGLSPTFRGDLYAFKWSAVYRIFRGQFGYGIDQITDEAGTVHHNTIILTENDCYFVGNDAIRSLLLTDKHGAAEEFTVTNKLYEEFQEEVNWSNSKNMIMVYDKRSANLLLAYTPSGSSTMDRVFCFNTVSKEFCRWDIEEIGGMTNYFDFGRQSILIDSVQSGPAVLDRNVFTIGKIEGTTTTDPTKEGDAIEPEIETGVLFPLKNPKVQVTFTKAWLLAKPTTKSVEVKIDYSLDGDEPTRQTVDTLGDGYGAVISDDPNVGGVIGVDLIGKMSQDIAILPFDIRGDANSIKLRVTNTPPVDDPAQPFEMYGLVIEYDYDEDTEEDTTV